MKSTNLKIILSLLIGIGIISMIINPNFYDIQFNIGFISTVILFILHFKYLKTSLFGTLILLILNTFNIFTLSLAFGLSAFGINLIALLLFVLLAFSYFNELAALFKTPKEEIESKKDAEVNYFTNKFKDLSPKELKAQLEKPLTEEARKAIKSLLSEKN